MKKNEFDDSFEAKDGFSIESAFDENENGDVVDDENIDGEDIGDENIDDEEDIIIDDEQADDEYDDRDFEEEYEFGEEEDMESENGKHSRKISKVALIGIIFLGIILVFAIWAVGTNSGRSAMMGIAAKFVHNNMQTDDTPLPNEDDPTPIIAMPDDEITDVGTLEIGDDGEVVIFDNDGNLIHEDIIPRSEDYVKTYLVFGIEEIDGAANTDALILVSVNTKDNTLKLTSILRDTYVQIPGWDKNKINSAYAKGAYNASTGSEARKKGAALLIRTIEQTFDIAISGYASVNFSSFENIIDRLGGIDIELGAKEAKYLNKTNYISKPENRNVVEGWNHLNGNQALGYSRVRKVETLGGSENDFGRAVRQRRVINAIIKKYKSSGLFDLLPIAKDCLGYVRTNLTEDQIQEVLTLVVNNGIYTTNSMRLPAEDFFYDSGKEGIFNGKKNITYTLVMDGHLEDNIKALHKFIFLDE